MYKLTTLLIALLLISTTALSKDYYWVGGSGDWAEYFYHWAMESGGSPSEDFESVPGPEDNVIFDENSFGAGEDTLYVTFGSDIVCRDLDFSRCEKHVVFGNYTEKDIRVYGSLTFIQNINLSLHNKSRISFEATEEGKTLFLAGNTIPCYVDFKGIGGSWTMLDSFKCSQIVVHTNGNINTNNQYILAAGFNSTGSLERELTLGNSLIEIGIFTWRTAGENLDFDAGTSLIRMLGLGGQIQYFESGGQTYHNVEIYTDNKYTQLNFDGIFNKIYINGEVQVNGSNTIDSLIIEQGNSIAFRQEETQTINELLKLNGDCKAYIYLYSKEQEINSSISSNNAEIDVKYTILKDIEALGNADFRAKYSVDLGNNPGWIIAKEQPRNLYWIGDNSAYWDDGENWSETSGGQGPACIPTPYDNVHFDENSFLNNDTVIYRNTTTFCKDMDWSKATGTPILKNENEVPLRIFGSLTLTSDIDLVLHNKSRISFEATEEGKTIFLAGNTIPCYVDFKGIGGGWTMLDSFRCSQIVVHTNGIINTNSQYIFAAGFNSTGSAERGLTLGNSLIEIGIFTWRTAGGNLEFDAGTSLIRMLGSGGQIQYFESGGQTYHNVEIYTDNKHTQVNYNGNYNKLFIDGEVQVNGSNTIDSLIIEQGNSIAFRQEETQTINKLLQLKGDCKAYIYLYSSEQGTKSSISSDHAEIDVQYALLKDIEAIGNADFRARYSIDLGNNPGWIIAKEQPRDLYWIGSKSVYWDDAENWSETSGGQGPVCIPTPYDNVYFDENSFSNNDSVVFRNTTTFCKDMDWSMATGTPVLKNENEVPLRIFGSLTLKSDIDLELHNKSRISFEATEEGKTIFLAENTIPCYVDFKGIGGGWTMLDSFKCAQIVVHTNGIINTNSQYIFAAGFNSTGSAERGLTLGSSLVEIEKFTWRTAGENLEFDAGTSLIRMLGSGGQIQYFESGGNTYHNVEIYTDNKYTQLNFDGIFNKIYINGEVQVNGSNTIDSLTIVSGSDITMKNGTIQSINNELEIYGNNCYPIVIHSSTAGEKATIYKESGVVSGDFLELRDIEATGGAEFYAGSFSTNVSGNSGWNFKDSPGYVYGFGEDRVLCIGDTLWTTNFHHPDSVRWEDGSTKPFHIVEKAGDYWVIAYYGDNCFWSDTININIINLSMENIDNMTLIEDTFHSDSSVVLTPAKPWQYGGMWFNTKIAVSKGFTTEFSFRFTEGSNPYHHEESPGADGFAFVIQNHTNSKLGLRGGGLGFEEMPNSFAVEFDTYKNDESNEEIPKINDPNENHLAVFCNGADSNVVDHLSSACLATLDLIDFMPILSDGTIYYCMIEYDYPDKEFKIWLDTTNQFTEPILTLTGIDLAQMMELHQDEFAWVGFTSATGLIFEQHEILTWYMCPEYTETVLVGVEDEVIIPSIVSINDNVRIYPNPVRDYLEIKNFTQPYQLEKNFELNIFDVLGKEVSYKSFNNSTPLSRGRLECVIDVSNLQPGIYFIKVSGEFLKFVKM